MGRNKYNAKKCDYGGHQFDSMAERDCFKLLQMLEKAGELQEIEVHVTTKLLPGITHKTDFMYYDNVRDCLVWAEYKGFETDRWRIIKKLWRLFGPGPLKIYKGSGVRMRVVEEILPQPMLIEAPEGSSCAKCESEVSQKH